jgi:hypothetical protein
MVKAAKAGIVAFALATLLSPAAGCTVVQVEKEPRQSEDKGH